MIQIEDVAGTEALPETLCVPEIDVVLIGELDLSASFGLPGQFGHPKVIKAVDGILRQVNDAGKVAGLPAATPDEAREAIRRGAR